MREAHLFTEFCRACRRLGIKGVTLHSYRYAWAEQVRTCGYPERLSQEALGHNSKALHRAYVKNAHVVIPTLEDYKQRLQLGIGEAPAPIALAMVLAIDAPTSGCVEIGAWHDNRSKGVLPVARFERSGYHSLTGGSISRETKTSE